MLADADVVEGFDALAPSVDLSLVEVAGGGGVREEQRQRQSLIHVLGGLGVRVDDGLPSNLVGVLIVLKVVVGHVGGRVVHAPDLAFLANLDLGGDRVNRARGMVDVRDRAGGRHGLQVLVVNAILQDRVAQRLPIGHGRNLDAVLGEQLTNLGGTRFQRTAAIGVLVKVIALAGRLGVVGRSEALERMAVFHGERVRGAVGMVGHGHEVHVGEVEAFFGAVANAFAGQEAVQVHLAEADSVTFLIGAANRGHCVDARVFGHRGERADCGFHGVRQSAVHGLGDVQRT